MSSKYVLPLNDSNATLETVGGKGMSLAKLARAGLPVPDGFPRHDGSLPPVRRGKRLADEDSLHAERCGRRRPCRAGSCFCFDWWILRWRNHPCRHRLGNRRLLLVTRHSINSSPVSVAVRSSATAEDLPGASFAGQQETYLNIRGEEAVLEAVRKCWASLWTARAIAYRARQNIAPDAVALAVVVQELVFADAAGIMFTANPIDGERNETIINAAWGLGEAIVSGAVTPDTLTVNKKKEK